MYFYQMRGNLRYWISQTLGWTVYFLFLLFTSLVLGDIQLTNLVFTQLFITVFAGLISTHALHVIYKRYGWGKQISTRLILVVLIRSLIAALIMTFITELIEDVMFKKSIKVNWKVFVFQYVGNVVLIIIWNLIYFLYHFIRQAYQERFRNISLEVARQEAELNQLKSQLNPHFLFNSLNGIRALISLNPEEAKMAITNLSELLRSSLNSGRLDKTGLKDELKMVENYLLIEKMRFEDRLHVEWIVNVKNTDITLPPFTLQLLVENAIKHGIAKEPLGGKLVIQVTEQENDIHIMVSNPGNFSSIGKEGIGIQNLKSRLNYFYQNNAVFNLNSSNDSVHAEVTIPIIE